MAGDVRQPRRDRSLGPEAAKIARRLRSALIVATAMVAAQAVSIATPAFGAGALAPVVKPSLSLSSYAAAASDVSYTIEFTTSATGSLAADAGTISVMAPTGTFPPAPACANAITVTDLSTGSSNTTASMCFSEVGTKGDRLVLQSPVSISGNNRVEVVVPGLDNPAGLGLHSLSVGTSSNSASTVDFRILGAGSIDNLSLSRSDNAPGASQVTYTVGFTTSATGDVAENTGIISVEAAPGTFPAPPGCGDPIVVTDLTTKASDQAGSLCSSEVGEQGERLLISSPVTIGGDNRIEVVVPGLDNPARAGPHTLVVGTSSDRTRSVGYTTAAPSHDVAGLTLAVTTLAARASEVTYTVEFTASASGALPAVSGAITIQAAVGTFPSAPPCGQAVATVTDLTTKASGQVDLCETEQAPVSQGGAKLELLTPVGIGAGQRAEIAITGLFNPKVPGPAVLALATSSDGTGSVGYTITGHGIPVAAVSVALSTSAARATRVTYTVDFTTSAAGGLAADWGEIALNAPDGTFPAAPPCGKDVATITNLSTKASAEDDLCSATVSDGGAHLQLSTPVAIGARQRAEMAVTGLDNPASPGPEALSLSTSSNSPGSVKYHIVPGTSVANVTVVLSNKAAGANGVTYAVGFSAPATGALAASSGAIELSAAPGTFLPAAKCADDAATVTDLTTKASASASSCFGASNVKTGSFGLVVPVAIRAGDKVVVTVSGLANPADVGPHSLLLTTSSNGVPAIASFAAVPGGPLGGHVGDTSGNTVRGAEVEACQPLSSQCYDALSGQNGSFKEVVPYGSYRLTAFPPEGTSLGQFTGSQLVAISTRAGTSAANVTMPVLQPLPAGVSIAGQDGGVPIFYSGSPAPMTVRGCRHGTGAVVLRGTNTATGKNVTFLLALAESPIGSGRYSAHLPPLWPVHGDVSISYYIYCPEAIAPTAGLAAGGTVVTLKGSGFTGATGVKFGTTPAATFKVLSDSVIEAVAPPGAGTVTVSVSTPRGLVRGGPLSRYTYISLGSVTPSDGPASGSTEIVIRGHDLGQVNTLWVGERQATNLKVISDDEITALTPPGSGDEPVTIAQITYRAPGEEVLNGPRPTLFFHYGARSAPVQGAEISAHPTGNAGPALSVEATGRRADGGAAAADEPLSFDPLPLSPGGAENQGTPAQPNGPGWTVDTPAKGIIAISLILLIYAIAVTPISPVLIAVALDGLGVAAVVKALSDPSGTVSDTNGGPIKRRDRRAGAGPTAEGPFMPAVAPSPGIEPHVNPQKTSINGQFHWDVVSDFYKVVASAPGCHAPGDPAQTTVTTPVLPVPPPRFGLDLVLQCSHQAPPARPTITSLSKYLVGTKGGSQIEVVGTGFTPAARVRFGPALSPAVTYVSPDLLDVIVPPGEGHVPVVVMTGGGAAVATAPSQLTYMTHPTISGISPASGPPAGGTRVTVHGAGLTRAELVQVGTSSATNFTVEPDGALEVTIPPGQEGNVDITVTTPVGTSTSTPHDRFTYAKTVSRPLVNMKHVGGA